VSFNTPRVWGRVYAPGDTQMTGPYTWQAVTPDANGNMDAVNITWLLQVLKLVLGESPLYSTVGIPAQASIVTQIFPDHYVQLVQQMFAQYFALLTITKIADPSPKYQVTVLRKTGQLSITTVPV